MPVSSPYLNSKLALLGLEEFNSILNNFNNIKTSIQASGLPNANNVLDSYKSSLLTNLTGKVQYYINQANIIALAGASEGSAKTALLTPIIAATAVNPASANNAVETTNMLADASEAAAQLVLLVDNITKLLS